MIKFYRSVKCQVLLARIDGEYYPFHIVTTPYQVKRSIEMGAILIPLLSPGNVYVR